MGDGNLDGKGGGQTPNSEPRLFPPFSPGTREEEERRGEEGEVQVAATTSTWTDLRSGYHGRRCVGAGGGGWRARSSRGARVYIGGLC